MFAIASDRVPRGEDFTERRIDSVKAAVSAAGKLINTSVFIDGDMGDNAVLLFKVTGDKLNRCIYIYIFIIEYLMYLIRVKLFVKVVRDVLYTIAKVLAHILRKDIAEPLFHKKADSALARLAVDSDDIALVFSSEVFQVNRKVRNCPCVKMLFLRAISYPWR